MNTKEKICFHYNKVWNNKFATSICSVFSQKYVEEHGPVRTAILYAVKNDAYILSLCVEQGTHAKIYFRKLCALSFIYTDQWVWSLRFRSTYSWSFLMNCVRHWCWKDIIFKDKGRWIATRHSVPFNLYVPYSP